MTPLEHAKKIAGDQGASLLDWERLTLERAIHAAILACCNAELERARAAEAQLEGIKEGGPVIVCMTTSTKLLVWNPEATRWAECSLSFCDAGLQS